MRKHFLSLLGVLLAGILSVGAFAQIPGTGLVYFPALVPNFSLIFTSASSQYLSATGKTSINRQKFTISLWVKRATTGAQVLYWAGNGTSNQTYIEFGTGNSLIFVSLTGGSIIAFKQTSAGYTDTTSWHNIVWAVDTTQPTAANRIRLYYDGTEVTSWSTNTIPAQNTSLSNNFASTYTVGADAAGGSPTVFFNGKLAQFYYVDGQQLTPSSFISGTPGVPIAYSNGYTGTFDFFLPFSSAGTTAALGNDFSGEGNNWTPVNMTTANQSTDYP
jgi:Concanavalin A-like lectin/glucanases superfamily